MRCFCAAASRLGTKSSPSESFTTTLFPSCFDSIGSPREERLGPDLQSSLDGLSEIARAAERRVHPPRATCLEERHDVLEAPVVAGRELPVEAVSAGVGEEGAPTAHVRGLEADRAEPGDAVIERRSQPSPRQDVRARIAVLAFLEFGQPAVPEVDSVRAIEIPEGRDLVRDGNLHAEPGHEGDQLLALAATGPTEGH